MAVATVQADSGSARTVPMEWGQVLRFWLWLEDGTHGINGDFGRGVWGKRRVQLNCSSVQSLKERSDLLSPGGGVPGEEQEWVWTGHQTAAGHAQTAGSGVVCICQRTDVVRSPRSAGRGEGRPHGGPRASLEVCKG